MLHGIPVSALDSEKGTEGGKSPFVLEFPHGKEPEGEKRAETPLAKEDGCKGSPWTPESLVNFFCMHGKQPQSEKRARAPARKAGTARVRGIHFAGFATFCRFLRARMMEARKQLRRRGKPPRQRGWPPWKKRGERRGAEERLEEEEEEKPEARSLPRVGTWQGRKIRKETKTQEKEGRMSKECPKSIRKTSVRSWPCQK